MKGAEQELSTFTEDHSRALMINALVEFNLIPPFDPNGDIPFLTSSMIDHLLPSTGHLANHIKANCINLALKMTEWRSKKTVAAQKELYKELAQFSGLDVKILTPLYLEKRAALKDTLQSRAVIAHDAVKSEEILNRLNSLSDETKQWMGARFRLFCPNTDGWTVENCIESDDENFLNYIEAITTILRKICTCQKPDHYYHLLLVLAKIIGREDFVDLLADNGVTLDNFPADMPHSYIDVLDFIMDDYAELSLNMPKPVKPQ